MDDVEAQVQADRAEAGQEAGDISEMYAKVFNSEAGRAVMADLERYVWAADGFRPELGFEMGAAFGFFREGQRQLVANIKHKAITGGYEDG